MTIASNTETTPIPGGAFIGHVHLKVADLDRAIWFYHEVMGFIRERGLDAIHEVNIPLDFDSLLGELNDPSVAAYLPQLRTFR